MRDGHLSEEGDAAYNIRCMASDSETSGTEKKSVINPRCHSTDVKL